MSNAHASEACPCGGGAYADCCGVLHAGGAAPDAQSLMRARYSAYVRGDADYLRRSWHSRTRPPDLGMGGSQPVWLGLSIRSARMCDADRAEVEFIARYRIGGGSVVRMRELSRFEREDGQWVYVDGDVS